MGIDMTTAVLPPPINFQGLTQNGSLNAFGFVATYAAGTTTPLATYTDATQATPNPNPVPLNAIGQAAIWLAPGTGYKFVETDQFGNQCGYADQINASGAGITSSLIPSINNVLNVGSPAFQWANGYFQQVTVNGFPVYSPQGIGYTPQTSAEIPALVTPTNFFFGTQPYDIRRYGALLDGIHDDTAALNTALSVAGQFFPGVTVGIGGSAISVPWGNCQLSSEVTLPNRVRVLGNNKRGSYFQAASTWNSGTSPYMFNAINGAQDIFDSTLENLAVDCNGIAGLGCITSSAWQDDCGLRGVLLTNFTTDGIKFQAGIGGADMVKIVDTEIFGNDLGVGTPNGNGINLSVPLGLVGAFCLDVSDTAITGGIQPLAKGIWTNGNSLTARCVHFEGCTDAIYIDGSGTISLDDIDGGPGITNLVHLASSFTGTLIMKNCKRNTAAVFLQDDRVGGYGTVSGTDYPLLIVNGDTTESAKGLAFASAWAQFDGTMTGANAPTAGFNVTTITRNSVGNYTATMLRPMLATSGASFGGCNLNNAFVATNLSSSSTVNIVITVAGTPTDSNEVKFLVFGG